MSAGIRLTWRRELNSILPGTVAPIISRIGYRWPELPVYCHKLDCPEELTEEDEGVVYPTVSAFRNLRHYADGDRVSASGLEVQVLETPAGRIAVTHGHTENVKWHLQNRCYLAEEYDCRCVCFGHTHVPVNETVAGIHLLNPGSLTNPRGGSKPSCALIVATEKNLTATIVNY